MRERIRPEGLVVGPGDPDSDMVFPRGTFPSGADESKDPGRLAVQGGVEGTDDSHVYRGDIGRPDQEMAPDQTVLTNGTWN